jgi:hypothetical protein
MQFTITASLFSLTTTLLLSTPVMSLGINCRGSSLCASDQFNCNGEPCPTFLLGEFNGAQLPGDTLYQNDQHIACVAAEGTDGALCAFLQDTASGATASEIGPHWQDLIDHGCHGCGSVPLNPGNDVSQGQLTINFVGGAPGCVGVCPT